MGMVLAFPMISEWWSWKAMLLTRLTFSRLITPALQTLSPLRTNVSSAAGDSNQVWCTTCIGVGSGGARGGQAPPIIWEGGQHTLWPPSNPPTCTGTIPLNSILEFSIISYFKMKNVIIWHWFIKNLVGTRRRNDVDVTSLRRIDVVTTLCAYWEFGPPWPPQNSKSCPPPPPPPPPIF